MKTVDEQIKMRLGHVDVLDHGYVKLVERWGSDERIIEAARMSVDKGFEGWGPFCKECGDAAIRYDGVESVCVACGAVAPDTAPGDERLLRRLWTHKHATPFEMGGLIIEVQAPIFVFREWHRHRTQSYNEMSARYTPLPDVNYVPSVERLMMRGGSNKQASAVKGSAELTREHAHLFRTNLTWEYIRQEDLYQRALKAGVPKELARCVLPVGRYSRMRASANLRNWLGFLTLRMAPDAQWEIRQYANAVATFVEKAFPRTWELFDSREVAPL